MNVCSVITASRFRTTISHAVYLLDDVLSALDASVAQHIVRHCLLGLLRHRTRICITENDTLHRHAHQVVHIAAGGHVMVQNGPLLADGFSSSCESLYDASCDLDAQSDGDANESGEVAGLDLSAGVVELSSIDSVLVEETKESGALSADVFVAYGRAMGCWSGMAVIVSVVVMQLTRNVSDLWLAHWVSQNASGYAAPKWFATLEVGQPANGSAEMWFLEVYASLALSNSLVTLVRAFVFAYAGLRAARFLHDRMLTSVMLVSMVGKGLNDFWKYFEILGSLISW